MDYLEILNGQLVFQGRREKRKKRKKYCWRQYFEKHHHAPPLEKEDAVKNPMTLRKEVFHYRIQPQALPRSNIMTNKMKRAYNFFNFFNFFYQITTWLLWANNYNEKAFMKLHKISWNHDLIILKPWLDHYIVLKKAKIP